MTPKVPEELRWSGNKGRQFTVRITDEMAEELKKLQAAWGVIQGTALTYVISLGLKAARKLKAPPKDLGTGG